MSDEEKLETLPSTRTGVPLYALARHAQALSDALDLVAADTVGGVISEEEASAKQTALQEALDALGTAIHEKADSIYRIIRNRNAHADVLEAESERLKQLAKTARAGITRLQAYLYDNLAAAGEDTQKVETTIGTITLSKRPAGDAVQVVNEAQVPSTFKKATLVLPLDAVPAHWADHVNKIEIDKAAINAVAAKEGLCPAGTTFVAPRRRLRLS